MRSVAFITCCLWLTTTAVFAQPSNRADASQQPWSGNWIVAPNTAPQAYGVYLFRKTFDVDKVPQSFPVRVSADNRYKLYVNGRLASHGPARGDLYNWNYESVDLAGFLQSGKNVIAALVWNEGEFRPEAQMTFQTGFILEGASATSASVSSGKSWKCMPQPGYAPIPVKVNAYYVAGAGEEVDLNKTITGWMEIGFDDSRWPEAQPIAMGLPKGVFRFDYRWMLVPSPLPQMEMSREWPEAVRKVSGISLPAGYPENQAPVTIPPRTRAVLLLDQSRLTNAYVTLEWDGGKDANIRLVYAESLVDASGTKGDRNAVEGKSISGRTDRLISSGRSGQSWTSLWWRTYRYIEVTVETADEPLVLRDLFGEFTGYPYHRESAFGNGSREAIKILDIGWHTARLCAVETYMDCPYYEQLQYIGDSRIQAMVTYFNTRDRRLVRHALNLMDQSQISEGLTLSRHPSYTPQIIPTFSLWYVHMLEDFRLYNDDEAYVREKVIRTRPTMRWFRNYLDAEGSIRHLPYWVFTDWVDAPGWESGVAPVGADGSSAVVDMLYLWTLQVAIRLEDDLGSGEVAAEYRQQEQLLRQTIRKKYWSAERGLYADRAERDLFSQHVNALAILAGLVDRGDLSSFARRVFTGIGLAPASIYFKYYLHQAGVEAGLGAEYFSWLSKWSENIRLGLTTWAEMSDVPRSRSDCHAWGASPNIEVFRSVLGISSVAPGFAAVRVRPGFDRSKPERHFGIIPHPKGEIGVVYEPVLDRKKKLTGWKADVKLPSGVTGRFEIDGRIIPLEGPSNFVFF